MARLPFSPDNLDGHDRSIYEAMVTRRKERGAPFGGPYAALMNHPVLCQKVEELGYYLKFEGHLSREVYQFAVLAVAKETGADFEWTDHVEHALAAGVPREVTDLLKKEGLAAASPHLPEPYQTASQVLKETLAWKSIPDEVQGRAIRSCGILGFVELVVLSGFYQMFSAINQGFDVEMPR
ncbi:MAG: carboxymuconolactone decarboxylase [Candidatus Eremiobacteraeota bacterium]|nr:carboxymuconolactone decarboxylase [Candidatus Eremiobacteraeota bacterium]